MKTCQLSAHTVFIRTYTLLVIIPYYVFHWKATKASFKPYILHTVLPWTTLNEISRLTRYQRRDTKEGVQCINLKKKKLASYNLSIILAIKGIFIKEKYILLTIFICVNKKWVDMVNITADEFTGKGSTTLSDKCLKLLFLKKKRSTHIWFR